MFSSLSNRSGITGVHNAFMNTITYRFTKQDDEVRGAGFLSCWRLPSVCPHSATSIVATPHCGARSFRLTSPLTVFQPPAALRGSPYGRVVGSLPGARLGFLRSLNRRLSRLERARCSFRANKLRSLAYGTPHWGDASFVCLLSHGCKALRSISF